MNRLISVLSVGLVCAILVGCGGSSSTATPPAGGKDKMGKMTDDKMQGGDKMGEKMGDKMDKMGDKMKDKMDGEKMKDKMDKMDDKK